MKYTDILRIATKWRYSGILFRVETIGTRSLAETAVSNFHSEEGGGKSSRKVGMYLLYHAMSQSRMP